MPAARSAKSIFLLAADLPEEARRGVLELHCAGDPGLRAEVESLLLHDPGRGALENLPHALESAPPHNILGPYTIDHLIAEGGSAAVYAARQANPERRVALKVLRRGIAADAWRRRFEREAEILARLDHPGIAHFYAFGTTAPPESRAYIAMELVEGETITAFAHRHGLTVPQRLRLLTQACEAAEYGHRRGIIHRDLKPGNILVSCEAGADPATARVRLIDFGIARMADSPSAMTTTGLMVGTPAYMSPEQVRSDPESTDARSDVYALGVVLYELCTGQTPFGAVESIPMEMLRRISEEEPTRLGLVNPTLRGDLEVIAAKALSHDPARRYQTAAELADDLRRFVEKRPILARRPSAVYLCRSFVRRNRFLTVSLGAAMLFLVTAVCVSVWAGFKSREEARESARDAEFWKETLESLWRAPGSHTMRRQLLARAIPHLENRAADRPDDVAVKLTLARAYTSLSDADLDEARLDECRYWRARAYALTREAHLAQPQDVSAFRDFARTIVLLGDVDKRIGADGPMFDRYEAALAMHERLAAEHPWDAGIADDLFWSYQRLADLYATRCGDTAAADRMFERQWATARAGYQRWPDAAAAIHSMAFTLMVRDSMLHSGIAGLSADYEESLVLARRLATDDNPSKQHIGLFVQLASGGAVRLQLSGRSSECDGLVRECEATLRATNRPAGEEPLLDEVWFNFFKAKIEIALARGDHAGAKAALIDSLPYARAIDAGPGGMVRKDAAQEVQSRIRDLEAAIKEQHGHPPASFN